MDEMQAVCQLCHATVTVPMPDEWHTPEGEILDADDLENDAEAMREYLTAQPCPSCGGPLRVAE